MAELHSDEIRSQEISRPCSRAIARLRLGAPWVGLIILKLWLVDGQRLIANGSLTIDDQWFVKRASWISSGQWLGPFEYRTLIKQPGYPIFIAAMHAIRLPLLLAHHLFYVLAVAVMMVALRPLLLTRRRRLFAFAILLFNPMTMNTAISARVDRAGVYPALILLLLAGLVGLVTSCDHPRRATIIWACSVSLTLGVVWLMREEWLLVVPAVTVGLALTIVRLVRSSLQPALRVAAIVGVALIPLSVMLGTLWLENVNEAHYGLAITNIEQTSMSAGIGPMFRVAPVTSFDRFPVTAETRKQIYAVSPQFAALQFEIEQRTDPRYFSTRPDGVRDLDGQVFQWVVLDALAAAGYATNARQLDTTFRRIGHEIDTACGDGRVRCSGPHSGIAPEWRWSRIPALAARTLSGLRKTVDLNAFTALSYPGDGTAADRALFTKMTNERLSPGPNDFFTRQRVHLIGTVRWLYRLLAVVAVFAAAVRATLAIRNRRAPSWPMFITVTLGSLIVIARTMGLAYLDLTAFPAFAPTYLAAGYAAALVVGVALVVA